MRDVLFELGTEELPSGSVRPLAEALLNYCTEALIRLGFSFSASRYYATPRRLAIVIDAVQTEQADQVVIRRGPAFAAGMSADGEPTQALQGFARACGVAITALEVMDTDKGRWWAYTQTVSGKSLAACLPEVIQGAVRALPVVKAMRWGRGEFAFVRPVHWVMLLLGDTVIPFDLFGCRSGNLTRGHRIHGAQAVLINSANDYVTALQQASVIVAFDVRRQTINAMIEQCAESIGGKATIPDALIEEVTSIVEWPQALLCQFDANLLHEVPEEALIAAMQVHQKCFSVMDVNTKKLLPYFITVANLQSNEPRRVIAGNERVMRARLSDAAFFYHQDKKHTLAEYALASDRVIFQDKLGSLLDKSKRLECLIEYCVPFFALNPLEAHRVAQLAKADLMTSMVNEFPELEGLMGYYYAQHDGESEPVATALREQYLPRFSGDALPKTELGTALALVDRLDTLVGIFAVGIRPSSAKDPFKLRRHALAIVRLLKQAPTSAPLCLSDLIQQSMQCYSNTLSISESLSVELKQFILDRLPAVYQQDGLPPKLVDAVLCCQSECLFDVEQRVSALRLFLNTPEALALLAVCKRINHLLHSAAPVPSNLVLDSTRCVAGAEQHVLRCLQALEQTRDAFVKTHTIRNAADYLAFLHELALIAQPVADFFEQVMVMVDDMALRTNRLALLQRLQCLLHSVANFSTL